MATRLAATRRRLAALVVAAWAATHGHGVADSKVPGHYIEANRSLVDTLDGPHNSNLIYLNGCFGTGCDFTPGTENSRTNTSSLIQETRHVPPFSGGQVEWDAIVDCVRKTYQPFDIRITDEDPGDEPHFEAVVAGLASDIGQVELIGGLAPFLCGETINNAITFTFAELVENDVAETCWVVAQETAHAFGLDHEYLCDDPMSYLRNCDYTKRFQDQDAPCGEYSARECSCGGPTQNSYQQLLAQFGPGVETPPTVAIESPRDGEDVPAGYAVRVTASDDLRVDAVEVRVNSVLIGTVTSEPYIVDVPSTVSDGRHRIEVTAIDNYDYRTTEVVEVLRGAPCKGSSCSSLEACVAGRCVPGEDAEDGLGTACRDNDDCASGRCRDYDGAKRCAEVCDEPGSCPEGYGCLCSDAEPECVPGHDDSGCRAASGASSWSATLLLLFALAYRRRNARAQTPDRLC